MPSHRTGPFLETKLYINIWIYQKLETYFYQKFENISVLKLETFEMDLFHILQFSKHF